VLQHTARAEVPELLLHECGQRGSPRTGTRRHVNEADLALTIAFGDLVYALVRFFRS
jgi:hypothetical protein